MDSQVEARARALARSIRARKEAIRDGKGIASRTPERNDERVRITGMVQALAILIGNPGSMSAAEDFVEKWRHDDNEEVPAEPSGMTNVKLRRLLGKEGGDPGGRVQICIKDGDSYAYYEVAKVTYMTGASPMDTIIETGEFISGG